MIATLTNTLSEASLATVERIADMSGFEALRDEWNELLQASDSNCLFLTWEWLYTWWKHLAGDRQLSILAVRCEGRLIALAPFGLRPASLLRRRPLPVLEFLGNGCVGSDYLDFIVRRGYELEARQAFASRLSKERLVLDWAQLRRGSCFAAGVAADLAATAELVSCRPLKLSGSWNGNKALNEREPAQLERAARSTAAENAPAAGSSARAPRVPTGWRVSETISNTCPFIPLAGVSWETYLATLGAEQRYNFNRKWKRLNRDYSVQFEPVQREEQCRESMDLVIELHNMRWRGRGGSDAFHTPGLVEFHREFSRIALKRGWLRLYVLRLNQTPAACLYGFSYGRTFYFYQSGFDPAYHKQSVGLVSMGLGIKSAIEEGAEEYDLLHGSEAYKSHWSRESRELGRLELYPPGGMGQICRQAVTLERASRRIARRVLTGIV